MGHEAQMDQPRGTVAECVELVAGAEYRGVRDLVVEAVRVEKVVHGDGDRGLGRVGRDVALGRKAIHPRSRWPMGCLRARARCCCSSDRQRKGGCSLGSRGLRRSPRRETSGCSIVLKA